VLSLAEASSRVDIRNMAQEDQSVDLEWMDALLDGADERDRRNASLSLAEMLLLPEMEAVEALAQRAIDLRFGDDGADWDEAPPGLRIVYDAWCVQGEVDNGGLFQWFFNNVWRDARPASPPAVAASLRQLGAHDQAAAVERAATILPEWYVDDPGLSREGMPASVETVLEQLDECFYGEPNLYELLARFVTEHPEAFLN
jgi:hypothetical protein